MPARNGAFRQLGDRDAPPRGTRRTLKQWLVATLLTPQFQRFVKVAAIERLALGENGETQCDILRSAAKLSNCKVLPCRITSDHYAADPSSGKPDETGGATNRLGEVDLCEPERWRASSHINGWSGHAGTRQNCGDVERGCSNPRRHAVCEDCGTAKRRSRPLSLNPMDCPERARP